jgi:hypothetical protein
METWPTGCDRAAFHRRRMEATWQRGQVWKPALRGAERLKDAQARLVVQWDGLYLETIPLHLFLFAS